ncbi:MAG TPA: diaminopimelate decarboxylase, partial [Rhizomicrobium sp.]|nr:diaminopimelate decarboxylase [Rhizomicrobium sp.]
AKTFLIIDAGMNDLIRPALYDAHHEITAIMEPAMGSPRLKYDVVGPVCETSDLFAAGRPLPELKSGDLVAILSAGAYGAVMGSSYNARPAACEVLVSGEQWGIVRPRETYADLIAKDRIPDWLAG